MLQEWGKYLHIEGECFEKTAKNESVKMIYWHCAQNSSSGLDHLHRCFVCTVCNIVYTFLLIVRSFLFIACGGVEVKLCTFLALLPHESEWFSASARKSSWCPLDRRLDDVHSCSDVIPKGKPFLCQTFEFSVSVCSHLLCWLWTRPVPTLLLYFEDLCVFNFVYLMKTHKIGLNGNIKTAY
jgi:hypothetical protein